MATKHQGGLFAREYAYNFGNPQKLPSPWQQIPLLDQEVIEVALAVPSRLATALEAAATKEGRTTGQLVRQIIREYLKQNRP